VGSGVTINQLIKQYKLETRRMAKPSIEDKIGSYIGSIVGIGILAVVFHFILKYTFAKDVPWFIDFFATLIFTRFGGIRMIWAYWIVLAVCLVLLYAGVPVPFIQR